MASVERVIAQFSNNFRQVRTSLGWSPAVLAERAGLDPALVEALESGAAEAFGDLDLGMLTALARVMDCDLSRFFEGAEAPQDQ